MLTFTLELTYFVKGDAIMNHSKRWMRIVTICLLMFSLLATTVYPGFSTTTAQAKSINLNKKTLNLEVGKTYTLTVVGSNQSATWKSNNTKVATVSKKGKVTAIKAGTATITATVSKSKFTCKVTVVKPANDTKDENNNSNNDGNKNSTEVKIYSYTEKELSCTRDGKKIYGVAIVPEGIDGKIPTVIISHGFNSNCSTSLMAGRLLAAQGIASYSFDFCGGSTTSKSDGKITEMSLMTEKADLNSVIDYVKTLDFVDTDHLFLFGISQGGCVAALAAAERQDEIKGMVLCCPAFNIPDMVKTLYPNAADVPETVVFNGVTLGKCYYDDIAKLDVFGEIQKYTKDVLIFHGDKDNTVPISYSENAVKLYPSSQLVLEKGEGHIFSMPVLYTVIQQANQFVKSHLK